MPITLTPTAYEQNAAEVVRELKSISRVTNQQIGDYLGLSGAVVQQRTTGVSKWSAGELVVLADFFEVPYDLFGMDPKEALIEAIQRHDIRSLRFRIRDEAGSSDLGERRSTWTGERAGQRGYRRAS